MTHAGAAVAENIKHAMLRLMTGLQNLRERGMSFRHII